jgi:hypothetical protein
MHIRIRSLLAAASGLALMCSMANAQLMLSGNTTGSFVDLAEAHTTVANSPDGSWATFHTGVPITGSTQSKIDFQNVSFTNVSSGDPIQIGLFTITNGMTKIGTGAPTAKFNVGLNLTSPEMMSFAVSTITFHIDHTINGATGTPDTFGVSFAQPAPTTIDGFKVQFTVSLEPAEFQVAENATIQKGDIYVTFTPVPEPATYAAWGSALLVGLVAFRRIRGGKSSALPIAA